MKSLLLTLTTGLSLLTLSAPLAEAQTARNCADRDKVVERLADKYGESRQALGLGAQGAMVEIFASEDSGSWTITMTMPNGATCLMATGQAFETLAEVLPTKGDDA
ncbi:hypothetical protein J7399_02950 [Shimia sp. R9_1]|uniref:hypothetical protein n=1 Tax=unclassified Shimia TaxID=2630038 RepID=UPI001ADB404D|nr:MULTISPECIES: hypothetical protein [unclassified Shimia]MBO9396512.1 hypothetical protein [Shimia sp. R9_2]MBO9406374.1 hypothetical protein [Shimia sp. R9_1]